MSKSVQGPLNLKGKEGRREGDKITEGNLGMKKSGS